MSLKSGFVIKIGGDSNLAKRGVGQGNLAASKINAKLMYIVPNVAVVIKLEHTGEMNRIDVDRISDAIECQCIKKMSLQDSSACLTRPGGLRNDTFTAWRLTLSESEFLKRRRRRKLYIGFKCSQSARLCFCRVADFTVVSSSCGAAYVAVGCG